MTHKGMKILHPCSRGRRLHKAGRLHADGDGYRETMTLTAAFAADEPVRDWARQSLDNLLPIRTEKSRR